MNNGFTLKPIYYICWFKSIAPEADSRASTKSQYRLVTQQRLLMLIPYKTKRSNARTIFCRFKWETFERTIKKI